MEGSTKKERIRAIERGVQEFWAEHRVFELDCPDDFEVGGARDKFLATFPYPYMNGLIHLGHLFTLTKAEFYTAFKRLCGVRALLPLAFHCTGMPICGAARKLSDELAGAASTDAAPAAAAAADATAHHSKRSKLVSKTDKSQAEILLKVGVPEADLPLFTDPNHWISFFPPKGQADLKYFGLRADWRRSFVTTEINPYYDAFVRWQFNHLREGGRIKYGTRMCVFSPLDDEPCPDHARATGETVIPQDYTGILMRLVALSAALAALGNAEPVFLVAATLRPETMLGQTNCWAKPGATYGVYQAEGRRLVCSHQAARNMAYQGTVRFTASEKGREPVQVATVCGDDLIGLRVEAPLSPASPVPVLPMFTIDMGMGTGIVTSVPADAPHDYAALLDIQAKPALREKFGIADELLEGLAPIPILRVPGMGEMSAVTACERLGITSQNDHQKLDKAKAECYTRGFYEGVMTAGAEIGVAGKPVQEAKEIARKHLIAQGLAVAYLEPASKVVSRSGNVCVVAPCEQWYISYGEEAWRTQVEECLARMDMFGTEARGQLEHTVSWLREWGCSRGTGLGTRMPWDPKYLIESLSDSTIYMAYYTVAHLLQGADNLTGRDRLGPAGIPSEVVDDAFFDFVFLGKPLAADHPALAAGLGASLQRLRREFEYWYPVDMRVSGKDLVCNHLVMYMYNHVALFPEDKWPRGIRANGHIMVDGEKMSKRLGNFITGREGVDRFTCDGLRMGLAEGGDSYDDANFVKENTDRAIKILAAIITDAEQFVADAAAGAFRTAGEAGTSATLAFADRVFQARMAEIFRKAFDDADACRFRDMCITAFREPRKALEEYKRLCGRGKLNGDLLLAFVEKQAVLIATIAPHVAEHIWRAVLKRGDSIFAARRFPARAELEEAHAAAVGLLLQWEHVVAISSLIGKRMNTVKGARPTKVSIHVASQHPEWRRRILAALREHLAADGASLTADPRAIARALIRDIDAPFRKKVIPFAINAHKEFLHVGASALQDTLPYDEIELLGATREFIAQTHGLHEVRVELDDANPIAEPGRPAIYF